MRKWHRVKDNMTGHVTKIYTDDYRYWGTRSAIVRVLTRLFWNVLKFMFRRSVLNFLFNMTEVLIPRKLRFGLKKYMKWTGNSYTKVKV